MNAFRTLLNMVLISLLIFPLSGCWSAIEVNDRAFIRVMILDKTENGIELTLGLPLPNRMSSGKAGAGSDTGDGAEPFTYVTKSGADIPEAYRKIQSDISRRVTFGQLRHIIIGRQMAQEGIKPLLDFITRGTDIHINASVFTTENEGKEFTQIPIVFERFPTDILTAYMRQRVTVITTFKDILRSLYTGGDFVVPTLTFGHQGAELENKGDEWMGTNGAAVFRQGRMVGALDQKEARASMWLLGRPVVSEIDIKSPDDGEKMSFLVRESKVHVRPSMIGNEVVFTVSCYGEADLIATESDLNPTDPSQERRLEQALNTDLNERLSRAVEHTKRLQSDAYGLGARFEWHFPNHWKRLKDGWRDRYQNNVKVMPESHIRYKWFGAAEEPSWNRILSGKEPSK